MTGLQQARASLCCEGRHRRNCSSGTGSWHERHESPSFILPTSVYPVQVWVDLGGGTAHNVELMSEFRHDEEKLFSSYRVRPASCMRAGCICFSRSVSLAMRGCVFNMQTICAAPCILTIAATLPCLRSSAGEYCDLSKFKRIYVVDLCRSLCEQARRSWLACNAVHSKLACIGAHGFHPAGAALDFFMPSVSAKHAGISIQLPSPPNIAHRRARRWRRGGGRT